MSEDSLDGIDALLETLSLDDLERRGWHRILNPETGAVAFIPSVPHHIPGSKEQRKLEDEWESRCQAMHDAQVPVKVEPKPVVNTLQERVDQLRRGD